MPPGYGPKGSNPLNNITPTAVINVTVTNTSTLIRITNPDRRILILSNTGNLNIFMSNDGTAVVNSGVPLLKGTSLIFGFQEDSPVKLSFHGITVGGSTTIAIAEFE